MDELFLEFSGNFVAKGIGDDDEDFFSIITIDDALDVVFEKVGLKGDVRDVPLQGRWTFGKGIGPMLAEFAQEPVDVDMFNMVDEF